MTVGELNFSIIFLLLLILDRFFNPFDCENQSLILEFLPAAMTPDTLIISYAKFYALQLVDDLFVEGLKSPCSQISVRRTIFFGNALVLKYFAQELTFFLVNLLLSP